MEQREVNEKENMRALEQKVDTLMRYCVAESEQVRRHYHVDLQAMLGNPAQKDVRSEIDRALSDLGVPDHLLGYAYLQCAIAIVVEQPECIYTVTALIYPNIARRFGTTASLVERAIRHAVESAVSSSTIHLPRWGRQTAIHNLSEKPLNLSLLKKSPKMETMNKKWKNSHKRGIM